MGFFNGTISGIARFRIDGYREDAVIHPLNDFDLLIKTKAFSNIFPENSEKNVGFVSIHDCLDADLSPEKTLLGDYRVFSLRIDSRKIPASSLRIRILEETKAMKERTGQKRLFREQRENIRETVRLDLLKKIPPVTAIFDVAVNMVTGTVYVSTLSRPVLQDLQDAFREAFKVVIVPVDPIPPQSDSNYQVDRLTIGREFLTWLLFKSHQVQVIKVFDKEEYAGVAFTNRIALESGEGEYMNTVVCTGEHSGLDEVKEALRQGKKVRDARIQITKEEKAWYFGYNGDSFQFKSVRLPLTLGAEEDESPEGRNLERLFLMSELVAAMDELFRIFFALRQSPQWTAEATAMISWVEREG